MRNSANAMRIIRTCGKKYEGILNISTARQIMKESGIKYANTYKLAYVADLSELVFYSEKTGYKCVVQNREDWTRSAEIKKISNREEFNTMAKRGYLCIDYIPEFAR